MGSGHFERLEKDDRPVVKPIVNKENKGQILIEKKQTGTNTPLAGAEFKVYIENADGTKEFFPDAGTRLITDTNGWVLVRDLPIGKTYTIEEVSAPEGYRLSAASKQTAVLQNPLQRVAVPFSNDAKPKLQVEKKLTDAAGKTVSLGNPPPLPLSCTASRRMAAWLRCKRTVKPLR